MSWLLGLLLLGGVLVLAYWPFSVWRSGDEESRAEREHVVRHHQIVGTGMLCVFSLVALGLAIDSYLNRPADYLEGTLELLISLVLAGLFIRRLRRARTR